MIASDVVAVAILRKARRCMPQRVLEALLEVVVAIIGREQRGLVEPQVFLDDLAVDQFGHAIAQGVVAVLDQVGRGLHAQQPALPAVLVVGDVAAVGFAGQVAVGVVSVGDVAVLGQLVGDIVAGRLPGDAAGRISLAGAVAVVVVGVRFNQNAIFHDAFQAAVVVVAVDVLVAAAIVQGFSFADDQAQVVVGQAVAVGGVAGYAGADVLRLAVGIVAALLLVAGCGNGLRQAVPVVSADGKAVGLGQQQVVVVAGGGAGWITHGGKATPGANDRAFS